MLSGGTENGLTITFQTYFNTRVKQLRLAAARKAEKEKRDAEEDRDSS